MKRKQDWRTRLNAALLDAKAQPFDWGDRDCALFCADCIKAMTGEDIAADLRGTYSTAMGALKAIRSTGADDLVSLAANRMTEIHPARATSGDLMAMRAEETGWALGICLGERVAVMSPTGFATVARSKAEKAFRVG
jgi:hypothetical protein